VQVTHQKGKQQNIVCYQWFVMFRLDDFPQKAEVESGEYTIFGIRTTWGKHAAWPT
jgi:hypothetical protein